MSTKLPVLHDLPFALSSRFVAAPQRGVVGEASGYGRNPLYVRPPASARNMAVIFMFHKHSLMCS